MGFIQPCFIESTDDNVIKRLEELGYRCYSNSYGEWYIPIEYCNYIECNTYNDTPFFIGIVCKPSWISLDCGTNKDLFFAVAALRDDTDENQWFTNGDEWAFCPKQEINSHLDTVYKNPTFMYNGLIFDNSTVKDCNILNYHKASVKELIEHFKKE